MQRGDDALYSHPDSRVQPCMFSIILFEPEIPPNTGNIIRLAANTGMALHLIEPLGFELDEPRLRRAGLDYREFAAVETHRNFETCLVALGRPRLFAVSTKGRMNHAAPDFKIGDAFLFGPETRGLPDDIIAATPAERCLRIPMQAGSRRLNLSNAASIVIYEAWRQQGFSGSNS